MLRIGEFSVLSSVSIHMLRHYDKIGLLVPEHVDQINGYRYYDRKQLVQANKIVALKAMGFGLDEIKEVKKMCQEEIAGLLQEKLDQKKDEMRRMQNQIGRLELALLTDAKNEEYALSVATKIIPEMWVVSCRGRIAEHPLEGLLWERLMKGCEKSGIRVDQTAAAMAIDRGETADGRLDVEVMFSLDRKRQAIAGLTVYQLPEREAASIIFPGSYARIGDINSFVAEWLESNYYEISGEAFSIYHNSPGNHKREEKFVTELCFPISQITC